MSGPPRTAENIRQYCWNLVSIQDVVSEHGVYITVEPFQSTLSCSGCFHSFSRLLNCFLL